MDSIKDIVKDVIGQIANNNPDQLKNVTAFWYSIISGKEAKHCCVTGIKEGVLYVTVDSSIWLYQIKMRQNKYLKQVTQKFLDIKRISFKIGKLHG